MSLGKKIVELRKNNNLSQEQVAEKLSVTRQTVSNWETNQTKPDIEQAKCISKIFNISLDELLENDVSNVLVTKISNTERLAGLIITILKIIGICLIISIVFATISILMFMAIKTKSITSMTTTITCELNDNMYTYEIEYDENNRIISSGGDSYLTNVLDLDKCEYSDQLLDKIENYFITNGGTCK